MKKPPTGLVTSAAHEAAFLDSAVALEARARAILDDATSGRIDLATANQLLLTAARNRTEAAKLAVRREEVEIMEDLLEHDRRRVGAGLGSITGRRGAR
jgi:hypothetical protein